MVVTTRRRAPYHGRGYSQSHGRWHDRRPQHRRSLDASTKPRVLAGSADAGPRCPDTAWSSPRSGYPSYCAHASSPPTSATPVPPPEWRSNGLSTPTRPPPCRRATLWAAAAKTCTACCWADCLAAALRLTLACVAGYSAFAFHRALGSPFVRPAFRPGSQQA